MKQNNSMLRLTAVVLLAAMLISTACITGVSFADTQVKSNEIVVDQATISGPDVDNPAEGIANLFDGDINTKLCTTFTRPFIINFSLESAAAVNTYRIGSAGDAEERDPSDWKFYGSADGEDWVLLDHRSEVDLPERLMYYTFTFENEVAYSHYMLEIGANNGLDAWGGDRVQFSEFQVDYTTPGEVQDIVKVEINTDTVKGSANLDGDQGILQIFDGSVDTKVCIPHVTTLWVSAQTTTYSAVCMYRIASANDHDPRDPRDWTLYGSNDGAEWIALDTRENVDMPERNTYYTFSFENTTAYCYYKLDITSNNGKDAVGLDVVQFSELQLFAPYSDIPATPEEPELPEETPIVPVDPFAIDTESVEGSEVNNPSEGLANLFDGNPYSKLCTTYDKTMYVSFRLVNPAVVNSYIISSAADADARDPKDWNFYGSVDGTEWVLLDTRANADLTDRNTAYKFVFENETEYSYFKFEVTANNGIDPWGFDLIQFAEFEVGYTAPEDIVIDPVKLPVDTSTVKGSADLEGGQGILQIFDGSVNTKVCIANVSSLWVSVKLESAAAVCMYRIASANDHDPRDPRDWTLYGSNNGEDWVALDTRENEDMPERNTYYVYTFENTTKYLYYKLDITSNNGEDAVGLQVVQFSEWQLFAMPSDIDQPAEPEAGFAEDEDGTRYYYEDGTFAKGWATIDGKTYRFDPETGILFTDPVLYATNNYYFNPDHSTVEGLVEEDGGLRFYKKGVRQYGWADTNGDGEKDTYFYVSSQLRCEEDRTLFDGVATRRFYKYNPETGFMEVVNGFYTNENGTQFFKNGLGQYGWITADGVSITDRPGITLSDVHYFAYGDGLNFYMVEESTKTIGGVDREFDENHLVKAYTGWSMNKKTGSSQYYIDGVMQQGWCETPDGWIYLSRSERLDLNIDYGDAFYGWRTIGGKVYYFRASTSDKPFVVISDAERELTYDGVRDTYYINQTPAGEELVGADFYITNPPADF